MANRNSNIVSKPKALTSAAELRALRDLEAPIRDLERAGKIAFLMMMHEVGDGAGEGDDLSLFAVEQVERLAGELREQFYAAFSGKAAAS